MSIPKRNSIICNEDSNEYFVNYNKVKVLKNGLNFTSLKVRVFPFFSTLLTVKVLKLLLKYSNALLLLRYCTTLPNRHVCSKWQQKTSNLITRETTSKLREPCTMQKTKNKLHVIIIIIFVFQISGCQTAP